MLKSTNRRHTSTKDVVKENYMEVIALLDIIVIWVLAGWLLAKIALPILNLISLILIGETLTHI